MNADDMPDSHVRLIFAAVLFRDHVMSAQELRSEAVAAFGPVTGNDVADILVRAFNPADPQ